MSELMFEHRTKTKVIVADDQLYWVGSHDADRFEASDCR
jgi:hypothetical protein